MDYNASDVALRNNKENGYWIIIEDLIYDVSRFMDTHPGGSVILMNNAGRDATLDFRSVSHHDSSRIKASLERLRIGHLCTVSFSEASLQIFYRQFLEMLWLVIEMQNTLCSDFSFLNKPCTYNETPDQLTPYKIDLLLETHSRFVNGYLSLIFDKLIKIESTAKNSLRFSHTNTLIDIDLQVDMVFIRNSIALIRRKNAGVSKSEIHYQNDWNAKMQAYKELTVNEDINLISEIKSRMVGGLKLFESGVIKDNAELLLPVYTCIGEAIAQYSLKIEKESRYILLVNNKNNIEFETLSQTIKNNVEEAF